MLYFLLYFLMMRNRSLKLKDFHGEKENRGEKKATGDYMEKMVF